MSGNNICKFICESEADLREFYSFVLEQSPEVMQKSRDLGINHLILITRGSIKFRYDSNEVLLNSGDLFFGFEGDVFSSHPIGSAEYMYITYRSSRINGLLKKFGINDQRRCFSGFDGLIPLWQESLSHASKENLALAAESMVLYAISRLTRESGGRDGVINRVIEYCEKNFKDPDLSMGTVARDLNYNTKYLSHLFKEKMETSFTDYLRMMRLKYAVSLLDHGLDSIKNVALLSGFSDPLYFSTVFKKSIGQSPTKYIEMVKSEKSKDAENPTPDEESPS